MFKKNTNLLTQRLLYVQWGSPSKQTLSMASLRSSRFFCFRFFFGGGGIKNWFTSQGHSQKPSQQVTNFSFCVNRTRVREYITHHTNTDELFFVCKIDDITDRNQSFHSFEWLLFGHTWRCFKVLFQTKKEFKNEWRILRFDYLVSFLELAEYFSVLFSYIVKQQILLVEVGGGGSGTICSFIFNVNCS